MGRIRDLTQLLYTQVYEGVLKVPTAATEVYIRASVATLRDGGISRSCMDGYKLDTDAVHTGV